MRQQRQAARQEFEASGASNRLTISGVDLRALAKLAVDNRAPSGRSLTARLAVRQHHPCGERSAFRLFCPARQIGRRDRFA